MAKIMVVGGLGFIGSHLVDELINKGNEVTVLDALKTGSDIRNCNSKAIYEIVDLFDYEKVKEVLKKCDFKQIYHLAAESHVDRAISNAQPFIDSNITGTYNLLKAMVECSDSTSSIDTSCRLLLFSTDELMGELATGSFKEGDVTKPKNMYSMTKQAQEAIVRSYYHSDGIDVVTSRCANIYGPRQNGEKFLPTIIQSILNNKSIPVYGDGKQVREWTYVQDAVEAAIFVMENGAINDVYHIGSEIEKYNIDVVNFVLNEMNGDKSLIKHVADRKGHDRRYSICIDRLKAMGWKPTTKFEDGFRRTIEWYKKNSR